MSIKYDKNDKIAAELINKIRQVIDPEIGISIVDMGLIYAVGTDKGSAEIEMTLTSPHCPLAAMIEEQVREKALEHEAIAEVEVKMVFDPPWTMDRIDEETRARLMRQ